MANILWEADTVTYTGFEKRTDSEFNDKTVLQATYQGKEHLYNYSSPYFSANFVPTDDWTLYFCMAPDLPATGTDYFYMLHIDGSGTKAFQIRFQNYTASSTLVYRIRALFNDGTNSNSLWGYPHLAAGANVSWANGLRSAKQFIAMVFDSTTDKISFYWNDSSLVYTPAGLTTVTSYTFGNVYSYFGSFNRNSTANMDGRFAKWNHFKAAHTANQVQRMFDWYKSIYGSVDTTP